MENKNTQYMNGNADDFTIFLFSNPPKEKNSIKLELNQSKEKIHIGLHIFQELLMIFTSGIKYLFGVDEKVDITNLEEKDINLINKYFESLGFNVIIDVFTIPDYLDNMKLPNYFHNKNLINDETLLNDFYYETSLKGMIYRVSFNFLKV